MLKKSARVGVDACAKEGGYLAGYVFVMPAYRKNEYVIVENLIVAASYCTLRQQQSFSIL